jgi:F0F1-type ATP synthase delta subunit
MLENEEKKILTALLSSAQPPSEDQEKRFVSFLQNKYGCEVRLLLCRGRNGVG